jgi:uncharacterized membrane protein
MLDTLLFPFAFAAALGCGLMGERQADVHDRNRWNHVRTITALIGAAAFICALCRMSAASA